LNLINIRRENIQQLSEFDVNPKNGSVLLIRHGDINEALVQQGVITKVQIDQLSANNMVKSVASGGE